MDEFKRRTPIRRFSSVPRDGARTSWLDDSEWDDLKNNASKNKHAFDSGKNDEKVELNIKLSLPKDKIDRLKSIKIKKLNLKTIFKKSNSTKKKLILASSICFAVVIAVGFTMFINNKKSTKAVAGVSKISSSTENSDIPEEKPKFAILYPGTKNEKTVGKIVRISPPAQAPAYTYLDNLSGIQIKVTQQELPDKFKGDQDGELGKLATAYNQKDIIQVDSVKVYVGNSTKGVQSLIFIKGNLLISITSANKISEESWVAYISSLHS